MKLDLLTKYNMYESRSQYFQKFIRVSFSLLIGLLIVLDPFGQTVTAEKPSMSGDFVKDTVSVAQSLKETIAISEKEENLSEAELANIKDKIIEMSQNRKVDGIITYKACLNFVSATK